MDVRFGSRVVDVPDLLNNQTMNTHNKLSHFNTIIISLIVSFSVVASACEQTNSETAASNNEALAMQYIEAYNAQDPDALQAVLADRIKMYGEEHEPDFLLNMIRKAWETFPDFYLEPTVIAGSDDYVTVRIVYTGTGEGELLGHDIDGKKVRATETILFGVTDGRISEYWYNSDELGFWTQLGIVESQYPEE